MKQLSATTDSSDSNSPHVNILPIPPPLEFPYPESGAESSNPPSIEPHHASVPSRNPIAKNGVPSAAEASATREVSDLPQTSRPRAKRRFLTDRPVPAHRGSLLRIRRDQTGHVSRLSHYAAGDHHSDESSSSSDNEPMSKLGPKPSDTSGRSPNHKRHSGHFAEANRKRKSSAGQFGRFSVGNDSYQTKGRVSKRDGRLNISVNETSDYGYLAHALGATWQRHLKKGDDKGEGALPNRSSSPLCGEDSEKRPDLTARLSALPAQPSSDGQMSRPKLNIVIMVIGSRGDIQPFLKVGKLLKEDYGHRVRIATHPAFKKFVELDSGLEFFSVGGDPAELMAFMVKHPNLIPNIETIRGGEIGRRREAMFEMFQGFWRACINAADDEKEPSNVRMMAGKHPFVADVIIANPPCFAHVHCAERLGVPLHLMFTFPYSPTQAFPHPLANIKSSNVDPSYTNFMSYPLVEMMTWQGLGDLVNRFRVKTLGLEPVSTLWAPGQLYRLKVPYTYMWSPGLVPKPPDWGPEIDIAGFVFLDLASSFKPPESLANFLDLGEPPVYIGFGSIVVDDPDKFTSLIFEAVKKAGVRALVSKGWGGLGDEGNTPENVYMLENTPHDWLFPRVSAVVHHGGAGTTAIGLKCGKPTMIVPFFGDQPFWGAMVARAGAGAHQAVPYKRLTADTLAEGIMQCLSPEAKAGAEKIAADIAEEGDGAKNAVESFHRHLPLKGEHSMRCSILPDHVAVWVLKDSSLRLSALAAELLFQEKKIKWQNLRLLRHYDWNDFEGPGEPLTGGGAALITSAGGIVKGVGGVPVRWAKRIRKRDKHVQKQKERRKSHTTHDNTQMGHTSQLNGVPQNEHKDATKDQDLGCLSPHSDEQCAENHLPAPETVPKAARFEGNKTGGLLLDRTLKSGSGSVQEADDEDEDSAVSETSNDHLAQNLAEDAGAGLAKTGEALAKAPMDLSLAIAQGFHNAPRLYGDSTVRTPPRISGIRSGLRAAGSEFVFGVYDGVTGIVTQPYRGAREGGALGLVQGIGKGLGGFVLKDLAAIIGPFGYTLKGVHKELIKGRQPTAFIRRARMIQGGQDVVELSETAKEHVLTKVEAAWRIISDIQKEHDAQTEEGLKGRIAVLQDQRKMGKNGAFETVDHAKKVLQTKQKDRRGRESEAVARSHNEARRRRRIFGRGKSSLKAGHMMNGGQTDVAVNGADRDDTGRPEVGKGK